MMTSHWYVSMVGFGAVCRCLNEAFLKGTRAQAFSNVPASSVVVKAGAAERLSFCCDLGERSAQINWTCLFSTRIRPPQNRFS